MLCRVLGQLPQLGDCNFTDADVQFPSPLRPPTSRCLLPLLPAIRSLGFFGPHSHDVLGLLVMWTRLPCGSSNAAPPSCIAWPFHDAVRFDVQSTSCGDRGWLDTLLHNQLPINFFISQASDLGGLLPDLKRHSRPMVLTMQSPVEPGVLGELLAAYSGQQLTLSIIPPPGAGDTPGAQGDEDAEQLAHQQQPQLTDQHLQAMLPHVARLSSLDIRDCGALSAGAVMEVVEGMGDGLTKLCLSDAKNVSDRILWALLRSCRKLRWLELNGAPSVTEAGLAPLRVVLKPSFSAHLCRTGVGWAKLKQQVKGQGVRCRLLSSGGAAAFSSDSIVTVHSSG
jgi:hypothetical protein